MEPFYMTPSIGGFCFYIDVDEYKYNFIVVLSCEWSTTVLREVPCKGLTDDEIRDQGESWIKKFQLDLFNSMKGFLAKGIK